MLVSADARISSTKPSVVVRVFLLMYEARRAIYCLIVILLRLGCFQGADCFVKGGTFVVIIDTVKLEND